MSHLTEPAGQPPVAYPFRITYERRWLSPDAEWVALFRSPDHPSDYSVNLLPAAKSVVLGRHPELDRGVVHLRLELHDGLEAAWAAGEVARPYFTKMGYPDTLIRIQGVEIEAAPTPDDKPFIAAVAMLAVVRSAEERLPYGAMLPWVTKRDCRGPGRHTVVGLVHELYTLLEQASDNLYLDEQVRQWTYQGPGGFARGPVQVSRQCPSRLRVDVARLCLQNEVARARFSELVAAVRCHPAVWTMNVTTGPGAGALEQTALVDAGFEDLDPGTYDNEESRMWSLKLGR